MQKIGSITSTADANGEWTNGNVAAGTPPTILDAAWLNTVQRELANIVAGGGLILDPNNDAQVLAALKLQIGPGRYLNTKLITSSGTYTKTPGTTKIRVRMVGGGGSGASGTVNSTTSYYSGGGGGGGGGYVEFLLDVTSISTVPCVIGSGGASVSAADGIAGGSTSFGSYASVVGGFGGFRLLTINITPAFFGACPAAGAFSTTGVTLINNDYGSPSGDCQVLANYARGGNGGSSRMGVGDLSVGINTAGISATRAGAGGTGVVSNSTSILYASGAGFRGQIIVEEYS